MGNLERFNENKHWKFWVSLIGLIFSILTILIWFASQTPKPEINHLVDDKFHTANKQNSDSLILKQIDKKPANLSYTIKNSDTAKTIKTIATVDSSNRTKPLQINNLSKGVSKLDTPKDSPHRNIATNKMNIEPVPTMPSQEIIRYTVVEHDNLFIIMHKLHTTIEDLRALNDLNSRLTVGQVIQAHSNIAPTSAWEIQQPEIKQYIVAEGETLYAVSKRLNTTVDDIIVLNNLKTVIVSAGQVIRYRSSK